MVLPLPPDYFVCPALGPDERAQLVRLAQTICQDTVQNALVLDAQPIAATIANTTTRRRARIRKGVDSRDASLEAMSCYTQVRASLDDVADLFYLNSTLKLRTFGRVLGKSIVDKATLYTLVDRPAERGKMTNPLHYIGVEWAAIDAPLGFATRDLCYLEAQDEFEFVDTRNRKRRGWVRAIHSIEIDACPSLTKSHGLVRAAVYRSGHVFIESESNPDMLDYYNVIAADPRGRLVPRAVTQHFMKAHVSQGLNLEEHLLLQRMQSDSNSMSWGNTVTSTLKSASYCMGCDAKFGLFLARRKCEQCSRVVCKACCSRWTKTTGAKTSRVCICRRCSQSLEDPEPVPFLNVTQALATASQYNLRSNQVIAPRPRRAPPASQRFPQISEDGAPEGESDVIMLWDDGQVSKRDGTFTFLSSSTSLHHTLRTNVSGYQSSFYSYQYSEDGAQVQTAPPSTYVSAPPKSIVEEAAMPVSASPTPSDISDIFDAVLEALESSDASCAAGMLSAKEGANAAARRVRLWNLDRYCRTRGSKSVIVPASDIPFDTAPWNAHVAAKLGPCVQARLEPEGPFEVQLAHLAIDRTGDETTMKPASAPPGTFGTLGLLSLPFVSAAGWAGVVQYERSKANHPPRGYTFVTGSMDDMVQDTLQTGDLVFFKRNCGFLPPKDGLSCFLSNHVESWQSRYNHCGFVLVDRLGEKYIVEETFAGVKCRPYSARILTSLSTEIVVVPLKVKRTIAMQQAANQFVQENVGRPSRFSLQHILNQMAKAEAASDGAPTHPAAGENAIDHMDFSYACEGLIAEVYQRMGLLPAEATNGYLHPTSATIKDWSAFRRVQLLQDAEFAQMLPIRLL
ncbi:hypothetical protein ACHHYP_17326 [Achlya hypogyna]|uniref:FYVE-type domain-containing protein n=1 Tax=Achlya hypogyna TaxID=1202772 RepID=A0A1V9Y4R9_ACHHY|nr:hypothetical protein ACHHYP_17326 [Achlya hypogyna]